MTNKEKLLNIGCKEEGFIIVPPTKLVVPVDSRRLKNWTEDRLQQYIKDIEISRL